MFSESFSQHKNVLAALFRKWETYFPPCNTGHVYATILEFSKNNDLFKNSQTLSSRTPEISRNFLDMASVRLQI